MINIILPLTLHRFWDIGLAFDRSKIANLATPLAFNPPPTKGIPVSYHRKWYVANTRYFVLHFCRTEFRYIFTHFYAVRPRSYRIRWNNANWGPLRRSRSLKVTGFGTNRKLMCDFLYIGWQRRNFFISYLCQLFFRHVVGQALRSVSYSDITFLVR